jgi:hypothetical protein
MRQCSRHGNASRAPFSPGVAVFVLVMKIRIGSYMWCGGDVATRQDAHAIETCRGGWLVETYKGSRHRRVSSPFHRRWVVAVPVEICMCHDGRGAIITGNNEMIINIYA